VPRTGVTGRTDGPAELGARQPVDHLGLDESLLELLEAWHNQSDVPTHLLRFSTCACVSLGRDGAGQGGKEGEPRREVDLLIADVAPHGGGAHVEEGVASETQAFKVEHARRCLPAGLIDEDTSKVRVELPVRECTD
jgi:hypothetical protein